MKREIKFRGKRIDNGELVYGDLVVNKATGTYRIWQDFANVKHGDFTESGLHECSGSLFDVYPKSVGQYIGQSDRNGKEIYEHDIIENTFTDKPFAEKKKFGTVRMVVCWDPGNQVSDNDHNNSMLTADPSCFNQRPGFYGKEIYNEKGYSCRMWSEFSGCTVIGNIHKNPELINSVQEKQLA